MNNFEATVGGLKINYKIFGKGIPFLILHGWGSNSNRWTFVAEKISQKGFKVVVPDLPGFGLSQPPFTSWSLNDYCDFIFNFLKILPEFSDGFYLLAHSFGGALGVKFALKYPEKIKKLFLVSASCIRKKTVKKDILVKMAKILKMFSFLPFYNFLRKLFYKLFFKSDYLDNEGVMKETYLKIIKEDLSKSLSSIKIPTIIIWGKKDRVTPLKHAYFINKQIKNSELIIIPSADHFLNQKAPYVLTRIIKNAILKKE